jgi:hypothetical protein
MIVAIAGRRTDPPDAATPRFPLARVDSVRRQIRDRLDRCGATTLVSSAAAGADLLALEEAGRLGLRRRVVLPSTRERFKQTSVIDRPGEWAALYDRVMSEVEAHGDLVVLTGDEGAYLAATECILSEATGLSIALHAPCAALVIWEGHPRGEHDLTAAFRDRAKARGFEMLEEVLTL